MLEMNGGQLLPFNMIGEERWLRSAVAASTHDEDTAQPKAADKSRLSSFWSPIDFTGVAKSDLALLRFARNDSRPGCHPERSEGSAFFRAHGEVGF
jgi:hypothetical protein